MEKEPKGFSVVVAVVAVVAAFFIGADYLRHWATFGHKKGASCWFLVASCFPEARKGGMAKVKETKEITVAEKPRAKIGRPLKVLSTEVTKKAIEAARLGIPLERIAIGCGFWNNGSGWQSYLARNPAFAAELEAARFDGEVELSSVVRSCGPGWQGSAWLLERTRGYVARAQLEHTGKGGKELSVSGALLGAFGGGK